eukprot:403349671
MMIMDDDYLHKAEDGIDPFAQVQTKEYHPFFYLGINVAYNLAKLIIIISLIYYIFYLLFGKGRSDGKRRSSSSSDNRASFMENLFATGDFQKDMQTLKNTLLNTKISHIEHVPKGKDNSITTTENGSGSKKNQPDRRVRFKDAPEVFLLM